MKQDRKKKEVIKNLSLVLRDVIDDPKIIFSVLDINLPTKKGDMFIYLSIFPDEKKDEVINLLRKETIKIKKAINKLKILKYIPKKIFFRYDPGLRFMQNIDKILK
jgi:ribosome-binding factor A